MFNFDYTYFENDVILLAQYLLVVNILLWLLSLAVGKAWPVDFIWSSWPIFQLSYLLFQKKQNESSWQLILHLIVTTLWGLRLTTNFVKRGGIGHEDWRYTDMRVQFGRGYNLISFITVFLAQSTFMFLGCLPFFSIAQCPDIPPFYTILGAIISFLGVILEYLADQQMDTFVLLKKNKKIKKKVLSTGLWSLSRHPNYCGELLFWWGTFLASFHGDGGVSISIIGPVLMSFLFFGISVNLMEERQLKNKPMEYAEYQKNVPSSIILLPSMTTLN